MLFPMPETSFVGDLTQRLEREADTRTQKSLLLALWYTVTPAGEAAILNRNVTLSRYNCNASGIVPPTLSGGSNLSWTSG